MLLRVNPGSLHRSKIHGSMFTFTANYEVLLGTSLTWTPILIIISAVLPVLIAKWNGIQSRSFHYFLGFGLAAESLLNGIAANTVQLKTTLISLLGHINLNTFKFFDTLSYCDIHLESWLRSSLPHLEYFHFLAHFWVWMLPQGNYYWSFLWSPKNLSPSVGESQGSEWYHKLPRGLEVR